MNIKKQNFKLAALLILTSLTLQISTSAFSQSVGISGEYFAIDSSAILELKDAKKGFLMTRLTTLQRDSICIGGAACYGYKPAQGLQIYNTTTNCYEGYIGSSWISIACGFVCGGTLTDSRDGNKYPTMQFGSQCWMAKNLAYLPMVHNNATFATRGGSSSAAYGVYLYDGNDTTIAKAKAEYSKYGVFYNWYAAMDGGTTCNGTGSSQPACSTPVQGPCPEGWHLPSHYEITALERSVCSSGSCATDFPYDVTTFGWRGTNEGSKLAKDTLWIDDLLSQNASIGTSGFSLLPVGHRDDLNGWFDILGNTAYLWSSTQNAGNTIQAWYRVLDKSSPKVPRSVLPKGHGFNVRCVKD